MAINIKNAEQIESMRKAGQIVAKTFEALKPYIKEGISTKELDAIGREFILSQNAIPSFLNYNGFPASLCISVNEVVIHGIPGIKRLKNGDIVSVDVGAIVNGYHGDAARTYAVGEISEADKKLIRVTEESFFEGIRYAVKNNHLNQISGAIEDHVVKNGFSVVRDWTGHGIGQKLHEEPEITNYRKSIRGSRLDNGMALAIEPMVNMGAYGVQTLSDGWTVVTLDKQKSAHYENTIIIQDDKPEIITMLQ